MFNCTRIECIANKPPPPVKISCFLEVDESGLGQDCETFENEGWSHCQSVSAECAKYPAGYLESVGTGGSLNCTRVECFGFSRATSLGKTSTALVGVTILSWISLLFT